MRPDFRGKNIFISLREYMLDPLTTKLILNAVKPLNGNDLKKFVKHELLYWLVFIITVTKISS